MKVRLVSLFLLLALVVMVGTVAAASPDPRNFRAHLSGKAEVPNPTDTQAQGQAIFQLSNDGTKLHYKLIAANVENVFMAHIHFAPVDQNGPIVVWLYGSPPAGPDEDLIQGRFDGVLAEGVITADDVIAPASNPDFDFDSLIDAIRSGNTYVNVHTVDNPAGEIRGQIH